MDGKVGSAGFYSTTSGNIARMCIMLRMISVHLLKITIKLYVKCIVWPSTTIKQQYDVSGRCHFGVILGSFSVSAELMLWRGRSSSSSSSSIELDFSEESSQ